MRVLFLLLMLAMAPDLWAQTNVSRGRVGGILGAGKTWDDEGSLGNGIVVGGRFDWRLFGGMSVEGAAEVLTHERSGFFQAEGESVILSASILQRFGGMAWQPYVLGGLTLVRHSGTTQFDIFRSDRNSTDGGFHFGGGLAVQVGQRFEVGPEARFYIIHASNSSDPAWAYWIAGRFGIRF